MGTYLMFAPMNPSFSLVIPTLNAEPFAARLIHSLQEQTLLPQTLLILDTHSNDNTRVIFERYGADVVLIEPSEFDHGTTRRLATERCLGDTDIVVFMTQDAAIADNESLERLVRVFEDNRIGAAYGRQLPRENAHPVEAHARIFNYPPMSQTKSIEDSDQLGIKTCFISNSFAAYRISALQEVGGFPENNIVSEETYVAARMLEAGWKIKYCAEAKVFHSHNYTIAKDFQRYFDLGVFHSREPWIRQRFGQAEGEGRRFVLSELSYLWKENILLIPSVLVRTMVKYLGFKFGFCEARLPRKVKVRMSMQKHYWRK